MSNSFYYFFSSTPQVLGGILALFGFFVIFKIQSLKSTLIGLGRTMAEESHIYEALRKEDLTELKSAVEINYNKEDEKYKKFNSMYSSLNSLINRTIKWSIFTAITIVFCLISISLGNFILDHLVILYTFFIIAIICIVISFSSLISILRNALKE